MKIIVRGCNGRMGRMISELAKEDKAIEIVAGLDLFPAEQAEYPIYRRLSDCKEEAEALIDVSSKQELIETLAEAEHRQLAYVLCTTDLDAAHREAVAEAAKQIPVLHSANMSLGVNLLMELLRQATKVLYEADFDTEIVERHHNKKLDAPSGTALALADTIRDAIAEASGDVYAYQFDRSPERKTREKKEIGIVSVRGGTIVGEHEVIFAGQDEVIELKHTAYSRKIFGKGALQAAKFLAGKPAGMYQMRDVVLA